MDKAKNKKITSSSVVKDKEKRKLKKDAEVVDSSELTTREGMEITDGKVHINIDKKTLRKILVVLIVLISFFLVIIVVDATFQWYEKTQIVARVNGKIITRKQLADDMIRMNGKEYIDEYLSLRILIEEKAAEENVVVTQKDIDEYLFEVYDVDSTKQLQDKLKLSGVTDVDFVYDRTKFLMYIEKLVGDVSVSDEEVNAELQSLRDMYKEDDMTDEDFDEVIASIGGRDIIVDRLKQQKNEQKIDELIVDLERSSTIDNYLSEDMDYEFLRLYKDLWEKWRQ